MIAGVGGNPLDLGLQRHYKDFAPRVGIAYRLNEKTVIRTGFGISYAPFPDNTYAYNYPVKQNNQFSANCSFCYVFLPSGQPATFQNGFPPFQSVVIPSNGIITNPDLNSAYFFINPRFRDPYVLSWNLAIQRSLPYNFALEVAYVGNHGVDQPANYNLNASTTLGADVAGQPLFQLFGKKANVEDRYVGYSSMYNGLQAKLDKRFSDGFALTTSFTYAKAMGMQSEDAGLDFYINARRNWRRLDFDRTFTFAQSYVYELPFGKNKKSLTSGPVGAILGGWQFNGILTIYSGHPLSYGFSGSSLKAPGNGNTLNYFGPGGIQITKGNGRDATWFNPTKCSASVTSNCFAQPGADFGNLGRNVIDGPGQWGLDASIFRNFNITERFKLQIRGEGFSVINTPKWNDPNTDITSANFGFITGAGGARSIQLGAKLIF